VVQLHPHRSEFDRLRTRVLVISFDEERWARAWLRDTGVSFPLLLDRERRVYRAYGLRRSVLRTWSPRTAWYYMRRLAAGARLPVVRGDPYQLGGDVIVDAGGIVRLAHRSRDPADRPPAERLLEVLRQLRPP